MHVGIEHRGEYIPLVSKMMPPFDGAPGANVGLQITGTTHLFGGDALRLTSGTATLS